jgi:phage gp46-like protein
MINQGDAWIFQTDDGGDIEIKVGVVTLRPGLDSSVYLSLFGGNLEDDGRPTNPRRWWGNLSETLDSRQYIGRLEDVLTRLPPVPFNLARYEDAAKQDLEWLTAERVASSVTVAASIPALNSVRIIVTIIADGQESDFEFTANWRASV